MPFAIPSIEVDELIRQERCSDPIIASLLSFNGACAAGNFWLLKPVYKRKQSAVSSSAKMKGFLIILSFLVGIVVPLPYQHHSNHFTRRLLNDEAEKMQPPKAKKVKHEMVMFDDVRTDDYYWLQDDNGTKPDVLSYINEENNYTNFIMSGTKYLQDQIYAEIRGQIKDNDITAPRRRGPYYYYERTLAGTDYYKYCRRLAPNGADQVSVYDVMPTGPDSPPENVILDMNLKAKGHTYYYIGAFRASPNHKLVAYTEYTEAAQNYTAYVMDAESKIPVGKSLVGVSYDVVWVGNENLLYTTMDATNRRDKVMLHKLGEEQSSDLCLYHENDENFSVDIEESESKKFVFVGSGNRTTRFIFYLDIANPEHGLVPLTPRVDGIHTSASHSGTHFFIKRRSDVFYNSELLACPVYNVSAMTVILPHRESVEITSLQLFSDHLVVFERENGLTKVILFNLPLLGNPVQMLQTAQAIEFMDPVYAITQLDSEFYSGILRFSYSTMRTPDIVYDYDLNTGISVIKKTDTVLGGFDPSNYVTERKWATSEDGTQVPMSIVYKKDLVKHDGSSPLIIYGYGAYGASIDPSFSGSVLPMLDRGFIYVIAHVRGGGEMGSQWTTNGKLLKKKNTFLDFIACAEYLIKIKYCTKEKLAIQGDYSGGLLITAVINKRPDLFRVATSASPFVDVLTTMLDQTNPRIKWQREEYGDPRNKDVYYYMKSYSPLDNVSAQQYPSVLVTSYYPSRSGSGSAKFVAKLRDLKTDKNLLLLKCHVRDGIDNKYWRFENFKEEAFKYAFILKSLNMVS